MSLAKPSFVIRDPQGVVGEIVALIEQLTGKPLQPAQVERIEADVIAFRESLVREAIQDAGMQSLVNFARAPILDYHGLKFGVLRLVAARAAVTVRFSFSAAPVTAQVIAAGLRVAAGGTVFTVRANTAVAAGTVYADVLCDALDAGVAGNGFAAGQINTLLDAVPGLAVSAVANTDTSAGGAEAEDDEGLRARIKLAPDAFSVAGPFKAYEFWARTAHPSIKAVAVTSPVPGTVNVYPLTATGLPSAPVLAAVQAALNDETIRPLNDLVQVIAPTEITYTISIDLTLYDSADQIATLAASEAAVAKLTAAHALSLGADIVRAQIAAAAHVPGVYRAVVVTPAVDTVLAKHEWAHATATALNVVGSVEG